MVARGISNVLICKKFLSSDAWKDVTKCMQILVTFSPPPECSPIIGMKFVKKSEMLLREGEKSTVLASQWLTARFP